MNPRDADIIVNPTAPPWSLPSALRKNNIDFVRFLLATAVILAHSYAIPTGNDFTEPLYLFSNGQRTLGGLAVDFFFILSGFLITHSWCRSPELLGFLKKRALRIYPAFVIASLFGVYLVAPLVSTDPRGTLAGIPHYQFAFDTLLLRGFSFDGAFPTNPMPRAVNGSLWSIPFEFWCYIGVACLGLLRILPRRQIWLLWIFPVVVIGSFTYDAMALNLGGGILGRIFGWPTLWARLLPCFLAGMVFYLFRSRIPYNPLLVLACLVALVVALRIPHAMPVAAPLAGSYLLFALAFAPRLKMTAFGHFGDFSYGLYVFAFPIQQALVTRVGSSVSPWLFFFYSFALTLPIAFASWHLVEKPFLRMKKRLPGQAACTYSGHR